MKYLVSGLAVKVALFWLMGDYFNTILFDILSYEIFSR